MKTVLLVCALMISSVAAADSVECTLESGDRSTSAELDLKTELDGYASGEGVYDLNHNFTVSCEKQNCSVYVTIDSGILEDEAGSTGFKFKRAGKTREIFREPVENAPDRREYLLYCSYKR